MTIEVLLFSSLREAVGESRLEVDVPPGSTGDDLLDLLEKAHPAIAPHRKVIRLAQNADYADTGCELHDGDEIALITPVSGG